MAAVHDGLVMLFFPQIDLSQYLVRHGQGSQLKGNGLLCCLKSQASDLHRVWNSSDRTNILKNGYILILHTSSAYCRVLQLNGLSQTSAVPARSPLFLVLR